MSDVATLTSKAQLTLPKAVREALGVGPGDQVRFVPSLRGFRIVAMNGDARRVRGMFKGRAGGPTTLEDMDRAIGEYLTAKHSRR